MILLSVYSNELKFLFIQYFLNTLIGFPMNTWVTLHCILFTTIIALNKTFAKILEKFIFEWILMFCIQQIVGLIVLISGLWMRSSITRVFEVSQFHFALPSLFIVTGIAMLVIGLFACCCTSNEKPTLLFTVSKHFNQ